MYNYKTIASYSIFYWINTLCIFWFFLTLIPGYSRWATDTLAVISIFYLPVFLTRVKKSIQPKNFLKPSTYWLISLISYGLVGIFRLYFSGEDDLSSYDRWFRFLLAGLLFLYLTKTRLNRGSIEYGVLFSLIVIFIYVVYENPPGRLSLGYNQTTTGSILAAYTCLALSVAFCKGPVYKKLIFIGGWAIGFYLTVRTGTRGAISAALIISFGFLILVAFENIKMALLVIMILVLPAGIYMSNNKLVESRYQATITEIEKLKSGASYGSIGSRFKLWEVAIRLGNSSPLFGVGMDQSNAISTYKELEPVNSLPSAVSNLPNFHSTYLEFYAKGGFILLATFLSLAISALYGVKKEAFMLIGSIVGVLLIASVTDVVMYSGMYIMLIMVGVSSIRAAYQPMPNDMVSDS